MLTVCNNFEDSLHFLVKLFYNSLTEVIFCSNRFKENMFDENLRFSQDTFNKGVMGGHCDLDLGSLRAEGEHKSALQSW